MKLILCFIRGAWEIFWGTIAIVPLIAFCLLAAISSLDYREFKNTLNHIV